jgi:predicted enzyme related to lactoylglutathione lyase
MASVLGLGGLFLKIEDQERWRAWYQTVLELSFDAWGGVAFPHPNKGYAVLSPFSPDTDYFEPSEAPFMINLIVDDIDGVLAKAAAAGASATGREDNDYGRFAWLMDPAGIKVELWQPT